MLIITYISLKQVILYNLWTLLWNIWNVKIVDVLNKYKPDQYNFEHTNSVVTLQKRILKKIKKIIGFSIGFHILPSHEDLQSIHH